MKQLLSSAIWVIEILWGKEKKIVFSKYKFLRSLLLEVFKSGLNKKKHKCSYPLSTNDGLSSLNKLGFLKVPSRPMYLWINYYDGTYDISVYLWRAYKIMKIHLNSNLLYV